MSMFSIFKKTNDKKADYKFRVPENTACIICEHVFNAERPILYVTHDSADGCWQFMCGLEYHDKLSTAPERVRKLVTSLKAENTEFIETNN